MGRAALRGFPGPHASDRGPFRFDLLFPDRPPLTHPCSRPSPTMPRTSLGRMLAPLSGPCSHLSPSRAIPLRRRRPLALTLGGSKRVSFLLPSRDVEQPPHVAALDGFGP